MILFFIKKKDIWILYENIKWNITPINIFINVFVYNTEFIIYANVDTLFSGDNQYLLLGIPIPPWQNGIIIDINTIINVITDTEDVYIAIKIGWKLI